jgi:hypothetical protein
MSAMEQISRMSTRMQAIGPDPNDKSGHGNATKRIRLQLPATLARQVIVTQLRGIPAKE